MLKKRLKHLLGIVLMIGTLGVPVQAQEKLSNNELTEQLIVQPRFTNISIFQTGFDISSTGKASVNVYLTAQNVDSVKVDASLQQYKNGAWTTIKSWTNTTAGTNAGLSGTYYVATGYSYRIVSNGFVYKGSKMIETTTYTSVSKYY
jgi:hypothetical protein